MTAAKKKAPKKATPAQQLARDAFKFVTAVEKSYSKVKQEPAAVAAFYVGLVQAMDAISTNLKGGSDLINRLKTEIIPQLFEDHKTKTVTIVLPDGDRRVTVSELLRVSIGEDKDKAKKWLKENGLADLVIETVNAGTLASAARTMAEEGKELDPDLFKSIVMRTTSVTKV